MTLLGVCRASDKDEDEDDNNGVFFVSCCIGTRFALTIIDRQVNVERKRWKEGDR